MRQPCRQVVRDRLVPILASGVASRYPPRNAAVLVMAGGMLASVPQAPVLQHHRHHTAAPSSGALLSPKSDMPWRHQTGRLAGGRSSGGASSVATQSLWACVYWSSRLGFPTRLFFRTSGHCSISSLVAALSRERGSLPGRAVEAKLSSVDPHDE